MFHGFEGRGKGDGFLAPRRSRSRGPGYCYIAQRANFDDSEQERSGESR